MTDNEIVKALECCINAESCCECAYTKMCDGTTIHQFALDLINRQKEEIERLRKAVEDADAANYKKAAEIERLNAKLEETREEYEG